MALTDAQIAAMGFGLPVGTDLIKNGDNEISKNARAAAEGIVEARWKKGIIPNGVDIREYMYGTEGQYTVLSAVETRTMTGLPQDLIDNPMGFTCVAETLKSGTALTLTVYDVWGNRKYSCTSAPSSGSNDGWTYWSKYKWDTGDDGEAQDTGSSASGFKTLPLILTAGRGGNEDKAPLSATVEYDVNLAASIYTPRFRFALRDGNPRWGTSTAQIIQLSNISVGGVAKLSSMATNADGSITFSPWMDGKLGNLKFDYVAQQQPRYIIGGGRVNGARRTEMPFELWLEIEVPASTPAIGLVGDSNSVGVNTTIPINDAWMSIYSRRMGFFPVLYGHSGDGMSQAMTADHYKWNRWNHLDRPDMVVHANGANDIPSTEGGVTLAQMQEWARNEWEISDAKISKIKHAAVIKSRASGINNTVRLQYNNWLKSKPDPIRDWQDIASPVTANDTGGLLPQYISSDGQHMNTAGQTAIGNSPLKVMTIEAFDSGLPARVNAIETKNDQQDTAIVEADNKAQSVVNRANAGEFDGEDGAAGLPGVNAVANDTATASYIESPISETGAALKSGFIQRRFTGVLYEDSNGYVFIKDESTAAGSTLRLEDTSNHDGSILHIAHRGGAVGAGQAYGINLANYPEAKGGFIGHQYSKKSPFFQIDNTDLNTAIYIRNTPNTTQNPGGVQTGDFFQLKPGSEASNRLILKDNLTFWNQTSLDFKVQADNATNYAFGVQTSKDIKGLVVTKTGTGPGSAVEVNNAGTQPGIWVKQTGAGNGLYVEGNKPEQFGKAVARFLGNTHAAQFDINADGGSAMLINKTSTGFGDAVRIINPGTGPSIDFRNAGGAVAKVNPNGEYENLTAGAGIILKSPNGTRYRVTATDAGEIALTIA